MRTAPPMCSMIAARTGGWSSGPNRVGHRGRHPAVTAGRGGPTSPRSPWPPLRWTADDPGPVAVLTSDVADVRRMAGHLDADVTVVAL